MIAKITVYLILFILLLIIFIKVFHFHKFKNFEEDNKSLAYKSLSEAEEYVKLISYEKKLRGRGFTQKQIQHMSILGKWLFSLEKNPPRRNFNRRYLILAWPPIEIIDHMRNSKRVTLWNECSTQNCEVSFNKKDLHRADAVMFYLRSLESSYLPKRKRIDQRWIFMLEDSPMTNLWTTRNSIGTYNGVFNWSMTYRIDSDVPIPFGRMIRRLTRTDDQYKSMSPSNYRWKFSLKHTKTKLLIVTDFDCHPGHEKWSYVRTLKNLLGDDMDIISTCSNTTICSNNFEQNCVALNVYKFYMSYEKLKCREYLTKAIFYAYHKGTIPIIMSAPKRDCELLLPPNSFIHLDDFNNPTDLAYYLLDLDFYDDEYFFYHQWRDYYAVLNEHGFFGSNPKYYCRVCEALNYNSNTTQIYDNFEYFWSPKKDCITKF